jgi:hypothetical protein
MIYIGIIGYRRPRNDLKMTPFETVSGPLYGQFSLYRSYNPSRTRFKAGQKGAFWGLAGPGTLRPARLQVPFALTSQPQGPSGPASLSGPAGRKSHSRGTT